MHLTKKKTLICLLAGASLSACATNSVEKEILQSAALDDIRNAPKEMHLAYMHCYALPEVDKKSCRRRVGHSHERRAGASSWDYILPFDYESERLGFAAFIRDKGKSCDRVDEGPRYDKKHRAYIVECNNGDQYRMRFDRKESMWQLEG